MEPLALGARVDVDAETYVWDLQRTASGRLQSPDRAPGGGGPSEEEEGGDDDAPLMPSGGGPAEPEGPSDRDLYEDLALDVDPALVDEFLENMRGAEGRAAAAAASPPRGLGTGGASSVRGLTEAGSVSSRKSKGGTQLVAAQLQSQLKDFETRRVAEQNEIDELELQCVVVREQVKNTAATLGGCYAVTTNDRQVAQLTEIMERRVLKAQESNMKEIARCRSLRAEVDRQRREKMTMLATVASIREDIAAVKKDNADTEAHIRERRAAEAASRAQGGALREAHEKACAKYAERLQAMGAEALPDLSLPKIDSARDNKGTMSVDEEKRLKTKLDDNRWHHGFLLMIMTRKDAALRRAREVVKELLEMTHTSSVEEFTSRYVDADERNYKLYQRIDALTAESARLESELVNARSALAVASRMSSMEDRDRRGVLRLFDGRIAAVNEKAAREKQMREDSLAAYSALTAGMTSLMDMLEIEQSAVGDATMSERFGLVEIKFHNLLVRYVAITKARRPRRSVADAGAASAQAVAAVGGGGADAAGSAAAAAGGGSPSGSPVDAPVVDEAAAAVGPDVPSGDLRRMLTVVAPSIGDAPLLSDQTLRPPSSAFNTRAAAAGGAPAAGSGGSISPSGVTPVASSGSRLAPLAQRPPSPLTQPDEPEAVVTMAALRTVPSAKRLVPLVHSEAPAAGAAAAPSS